MKEMDSIRCHHNSLSLQEAGGTHQSTPHLSGSFGIQGAGNIVKNVRFSTAVYCASHGNSLALPAAERLGMCCIAFLEPANVFRKGACAESLKVTILVLVASSKDNVITNRACLLQPDVLTDIGDTFRQQRQLLFAR